MQVQEAVRLPLLALLVLGACHLPEHRPRVVAPGALERVEALREALDRRDMAAIAEMLSPQCRLSGPGFVPLVQEKGGGYEAASWVERLDGGYVLLDLFRILASYDRVHVQLAPMQMRIFEGRVLLRARLVLRGIDGEGLRRVDTGLVDLDLRRGPSGWRVHGLRPAQVNTLRIEPDEGFRVTDLAHTTTTAPEAELDLPGRRYPAARAALDVDGDGRFELVTTRGDAVLLVPGGRTPPRELTRVRGPRVLRTLDVDGDGRPDLFVGSDGAESRLLLNRGARFERLAGFAPTGRVTDASVADLDGDGRLDLYLVRHGQENLAFLGRDGTLRPARGGLAADAGLGLAACAGDLDADGDVDLFVANELEASRLWINQGKGRFVVRRSFPPATACAIGDVDNDGRLDLLTGGRRGDEAFLFGRPGVGAPGDGLVARRGRIRPYTVGDNLWLSRGSLRFERRWLPDSGWTDWAGLVDHDSDGRLDALLLRYQPSPALERRWWWQVLGPRLRGRAPRTPLRARLAAGPPRLWVNLGGRFADGGALWPLPRAATGLAHDLDGDGAPELLLDDAQLSWRAAGRGHGALLRLRGKAPNADAVGSRVEVLAEGRGQLREVGHASGLPGGPPGYVHVGVGTALRLERVTVRWPDGTRQSFVDLPVGQLVVLTQGGHASWGEPEEPASAPEPASRPASRPTEPAPPASAPAWRLPGRVLDLTVLAGDKQPVALSRFAGRRGTVVLFVVGRHDDLCRQLKRLAGGQRIGVVVVALDDTPGRCGLPLVRPTSGTKGALAGAGALLPLAAVVDTKGNTLRLVGGGAIDASLLSGL